MSAAAVSASNSSGICGTQTEASPASSAHRASATQPLDLGGVAAPLGADHHADAHVPASLSLVRTYFSS